jgi:hypothetical protein
MKSTKLLIPVTKWEHPHWDMKLILPNDGSRGKPEDYLGSDDDATQLKAKEHDWMSAGELDALPEFG